MRRVLRATVLALALMPVITMVVGRLGPFGRGLLPMVGFFAMGLLSIHFVGFAVTRIAALLVRWIVRWRSGSAAASAGAVDPSRRAFLQRGVDAALMGGAATLSVAGYAEAMRLPRVVDVEVPIEGLPAAFDGYTIVQLTDVHVGPTIGRAYLEGLVARCRGLAPDMVAVTGDLVDGFVPDLAPDVSPLADLAAPDGVYFVTGNHEYYWDGRAWCAHLRTLGLTVLENEHRVVERNGARIVVAGICDHRAARFVPEHAPDPARALAGAPSGAPVVMLAHQPRSAKACIDAGARLVLCGHTHGGQYFPMNLLVHLVQPFVAGLARASRGWVYVSRGSGYWGPPNRLGSPSEITRIVLRAAEGPG
ncbi:MAG: metallophosphoesterase [Deltaproteobacteria bacterium]|nr:MAG: metallophosphoesterase [Deltaproteobacteria bacterium]